MKKLLLIAILAVVLVLPMQKVEAKSYKLQTEHYKNNVPYDCSVTKKPATPKWVWYRYPMPKHKDRDPANNGRVHLIWEDSDRAHDVEIRVIGNGKKRTIETEDDAQTIIKKLKNGKFYTFQVRGVSNCGTGGWSDKLKVKP